MNDRWKQWARTLKRDAHALYLAARDPRVPWFTKGLAATVATYAASPIVWQPGLRSVDCSGLTRK